MKHFSVWVYIFFLALNLHAQNKTDAPQQDPREMFLEAESYFLYEEYNEALPLYMRLSKQFPDNKNLLYRIGICLLNSPYDKSRSIDYLEKAVKSVNKEHKETSLKELNAPADAWFYLGNAYRINNQLDKALKAYDNFKEIMDPAIYDAELVEEQIKACKNAKQLMKDKLDVDFLNIGEPINSRFPDINAVLSADENSMLFVRKQQFFDAVYYAKRINGQWQEPMEIMFDLGIDNDMYPTCLSPDGKFALFYSNDNLLGTIFSSTLVNGKWTKVKPLNEKINTKYWESHACITADGTRLYFTSNRKGGYGGLDIYMATKNKAGDWDNPVNLGPNINTRYNEETPFITEDGKTLYFSSYGHFNIGGYDVFYSNLLDNGSWTKPLNAGYPINSTFDDIFFVPLSNGKLAYMPRYKEDEGLGRTDIYRFEIYSELHPRKFSIKGIVRLEGAIPSPGNPVSFTVINRQNADTIKSFTVHKENGEYQFEIPTGEYDVLISSIGFKSRIEKLLLPKDFKSGGISLNTRLQAEEKIIPVYSNKEETMARIEITKNQFLVNSADPLKIKLGLENGNLLQVQAYIDSILVKSENLEINRKKITYEYIPQPGRNKIIFRLTGKDGSVVSDSVLIEYPPSEKEKITSLSVIQNIQSSNLESIVGYFKNNASGNLKKFIDQTNISQSGIESDTEWIEYLLSQSQTNGYSQEEVLRLVAKMNSQMPLDVFIEKLILHSEGNLKKSLLDLNTNQDSIKTAEDVVQYLLKNAEKYKSERIEVLHLLTRLAAADTPDPSQFLKKLMAFSDPETARFLEEFQKDKSNYPDVISLIDGILAAAKEAKIEEDKIITALTQAASSYPVSEMIQMLLPFATPDLIKYLEQLSPQKEGIYSSDQLLRFLMSYSAEGKYSTSDVLRMFLNFAGNSQDKTVLLRELLLQNTQGELNKTLEKLDLILEKIETNEELVEYLMRQSSEKTYSKQEVIQALVTLSFEGDPADHLIRLSQLVAGDTARFILSIDPSKEGIHSLPGIYQYLLQNAHKTGLTESQVEELFMRYLIAREIDFYLQIMIPLATGNLASSLMDINPYQLRINSVSSLVDYLMAHSASSGYTQPDLLDLLAKMDERLLLELFIADAKKIAQGPLRKELMNIQPEVLKIYSRKNYLRYLINQATDTSFTALEILPVITGMMYQQGITVQQIQSNLTANRSINISPSIKQILSAKYPESLKGLNDLSDKLAKSKLATAGTIYLFLTALESIEAELFLNQSEKFATAELNAYLKNKFAKIDTLRSRELLIQIVNHAAGKGEISPIDAGRLWSQHQEVFLSYLASHVYGKDNPPLPNYSASPDSNQILLLRESFLKWIQEASVSGNNSIQAMADLLNSRDKREIELFLEMLQKYATGNLKKVLSGIDIARDSIDSANELIGLLLSKAELNGYTEVEVLKLLVKTVNNLIPRLLNQNLYKQELLHRNNILPGLLTLTAITVLLVLFIIVLRKRRTRKEKKLS